MRGLGLVVVVALLASSPARAHHGTATNRADGASGALGVGAGLARAGAAGLDASLSAELSVFGRRLEGSTPHEGGGALVVHTWSPTLGFTFASGTRAGLRLPVGLVHTDPEYGDSASAAGLGDLELAISQDVLRPFGVSTGGPVELRAQVGLQAPTGRYDAESALAITRVEDGAGGALDVVTYDTRASLGAGAWRLAGALEARARLLPSLHVFGAARLGGPLDRTPDDIRWGLDLVGQLGVSWVPWADRLGLIAGLAHRWHTKDTVPGEDRETGAPTRERVGGRQELGALLGLDLAVTRRLVCGARAHVPAWQHAGGVQLVETVSAQLSCGYRWPM